MGRTLRLFTALIITTFIYPAQAKSKSADTPEVPIFRSDTRIVLVDVVATDAHGAPVRGLKAEDFQVLDDGKPQKIRGFDERTSDQSSDQPVEKPPLLGPGIYSNWTPTKVNGATNVLLLDTLNLDQTYHAYARREMLRYLKNLPPGQQVALFTLGRQLRMVQGVTGSTDELMATVNKMGDLSGFKDSDTKAQREILDKMGSPQVSVEGGSQSSAASVLQTPAPGVHTPESILQDFLNAETMQIADLRIRVTLEALRDLSRALGAIPGRKNLIWISGDFPIMVGSYTERSDFHLYDREIRATAALMAAQQIAVYPIDARGLLTTPGSQLFATQAAMDEIAQQTGGRAFYNSNDIKAALKESIDSGSRYYTVSYSPSNKNWDGRLRKIEVKVARRGINLNYRRGYYAVADPFAPVLKIKTTDVDVQKRLIEAVQPGTPPASGIMLKAKALAPGGEKPVEIDYVIDAHNLSLEFNPDGTRKVAYQLVAVAWGNDEKNAAQAWEMVDKEISEKHASEIIEKGIKSRRFLTLKPGSYNLYIGVIDVPSKKLGTLVLPLDVPERATATAAAPAQNQTTPTPSAGFTLPQTTAESEIDPLEGADVEIEPQDEPSDLKLTVADESQREPQVEAAKAAPAEASEKDGVFTFRTGVEEVLVDAGVRDSKRRLVADLKKQDFKILEDGVERPIVAFSFDQVPIAVALVLDRSGSMQKNISELQRTAATILSGLKPQDKVALFAFDSRVDRLVDLTTDRNQVAEALGKIDSGGSTDAVNALFVATLYLKQHAPGMRRVALLVSDNEAVSFTIARDGRLRSELDLINTALECETAVYDLRIAIRQRKSPYPYLLSMKKITEQTGGEMISSASVGKMLEEVIQTLRSRYVLGFKPAQSENTGTLHAIELQLRTDSGKYSLRFRRGYRATPDGLRLSESVFRTGAQ